MINKAAQQVIDRIARVMEEQPKFDAQKIELAFKRQYELLGVPMPEVVVADDFVFGFKIAHGAARDAAWDAAWGAAWDVARGAARDAAWGAAWDVARGVAWGAAWDAARDAAWGAARDAAWGAARGAARGAAWGVARGVARDVARGVAWGAAWDVARGAAALNTGSKDKRVLKYIAIETEMLKALEAGLGWYFPMKDKLILVPFPDMKTDTSRRLHSVEKKAVEWSNGEGFYFVHGVRFGGPLWKKVTSQKMTFKQIVNLENMEQRMIALKLMDPEAMLKGVEAKLLDKSPRGNELYLVKEIFSQPAYFLKYKDPSTDRVYISGIDPEYAQENPKADDCMAWKHNLTPKQYAGLKVEA